MFQRLVPLVSWTHAGRFEAEVHDQIVTLPFLPRPSDSEYRALNLEGNSAEPLEQIRYLQKMMLKVKR